MRYKQELESEMIGKYLDEIDKMRADNVALRADNSRLKAELELQSARPADPAEVLADKLSSTQEQAERLEAELSQLRGTEPCDECGVDTVKLLDERDRLTEVVKACEVALECSASMNPGRSDLKFNDQWERARLQSVHALALIHTLQSGEKKEGEK